MGRLLSSYWWYMSFRLREVVVLLLARLAGGSVTPLGGEIKMGGVTLLEKARAGLRICAEWMLLEVRGIGEGCSDT
jgi:hypothetical protein